MEQGGAERVMSELANYYALCNINVHLVLLTGAKDFYVLHDSITIHRLGFLNKGKFSKVKAEILTLFKLRTLIKKENPEFILSFMEKYNIFTLLASSFLNKKVFVSDRSNPLKKRTFYNRFS